MHIGGSVTGSALVTGDGNKVNVHYQHASLPPTESVDLRSKLQAIHDIRVESVGTLVLADFRGQGVP